MTDPIKVAVLGMAHDHLWGNLKELADQEETLLVGGADPNPVLQDRFRERTGCNQVYGEYEALLDAQTPDAVFVFSATAHHAPIVELCAARGIHVMVEKPMAATLEQADRMLTAAQRHQICLMVNWPTAWSRPLHTAHRLVGEGAIGQLWQLTWRGGHCGPDELGCSDEFCGFLFDPQLNGAGAFNDYSGYGASLCVHFLGRPHSVVAMAGRLLKTHLPVDDNGIMVLRYPQALCRLEMTWTEAVPHVPSHDVVLYGTEGTIAVGNQVTVHTRQNREGTEAELDELSVSERNAATHFLHCIRSGQPPQGTTNATQSRHAQEIMEAGLQAATSGVEVSLPIEGHLFRARRTRRGHATHRRPGRSAGGAARRGAPHPRPDLAL